MSPLVLAHGSGIDDVAIVIGAAALIYTVSLTLRRSDRRFHDFDHMEDGRGSDGGKFPLD